MKPQTTNYKPQIKLGFTLIESLVAITILVIGVLGPMTAATRGITDGFYAQNQLIATHLAQEGLELLSTQIKNNNKADINESLDHDQIGGIDIDDLLYGLGTCKNNNPCSVVIGNSGDFSFSSCLGVNSSNCNLAFHTSSNFYEKYDPDSPTGFTGPVFTRILYVEELTATEVLLKSEVNWRNKQTSPLQTIKLTRYAFHEI